MSGGRRDRILIRHRVNSIADLEALDPAWGAEIDLRSRPDRPSRIHLAHDPWLEGDDFEAWLDAYAARGPRGTLVLNTKEDGLEARALELVRARGIRELFFLDTAAPTLARWALGAHARHFAARLSRYEPPAALAPYEGKVGWIWVDCFGAEPLDAALVAALVASQSAEPGERARLCLVSPELQGGGLDLIPRFRALFELCDAVCTKRPEAWAALV